MCVCMYTIDAKKKYTWRSNGKKIFICYVMKWKSIGFRDENCLEKIFQWWWWPNVTWIYMQRERIDTGTNSILNHRIFVDIELQFDAVLFKVNTIWGLKGRLYRRVTNSKLCQTSIIFFCFGFISHYFLSITKKMWKWKEIPKRITKCHLLSHNIFMWSFVTCGMTLMSH